VGADRKGVIFIGNKESNKHTYIQTFNFIYYYRYRVIGSGILSVCFSVHFQCSLQIRNSAFDNHTEYENNSVTAIKEKYTVHINVEL